VDQELWIKSLGSRPFDQNIRQRRLNHSGGLPIPYATNDDLPDSVRHHLPPHAQDIYRAAFNSAYVDHAGDPRQEEAAHRIAWAAVKRRYVKAGDRWVARDDDG
jgi:cation transport regulator